MDNTKQSASDQLRSKAKKLEMLATLLEDGEIASELAGLFSFPCPRACASSSRTAVGCLDNL